MQGNARFIVFMLLSVLVLSSVIFAVSRMGGVTTIGVVPPQKDLYFFKKGDTKVIHGVQFAYIKTEENIPCTTQNCTSATDKGVLMRITESGASETIRVNTSSGTAFGAFVLEIVSLDPKGGPPGLTIRITAPDL